MLWVVMSPSRGPILKKAKNKNRIIQSKNIHKKTEKTNVFLLKYICCIQSGKKNDSEI